MFFNSFLAVTDIPSLLTELGGIISACMSIFTSNWILTGLLVVSVGIPILAAVFSLISHFRKG